MTDTQTWRVPLLGAARRRAGTAGRRDGRAHRIRLRCWALLNAQALLNGAAGVPGSVAAAEDDHQRLAGPWAG